MTTVGHYASRLDAEIAKLTLECEGISTQVVGIGVGMEGGMSGVQLMVPDAQADKARALIETG